MVNLIQDSGFELSGSTVWTYVNAARTLETLFNTFAARLNPGGSVSQIIQFQPNTTYFLQFKYRPWSRQPIVVNAGGVTLSFPVPVISETYVNVPPQTFTTGATPTNIIKFSCDDVVFIDNVDLELVGGTPPASQTFIRDVHVIENKECSVYVYKNGSIVGNARAYAPVSVSLVAGDTWGAQTAVPQPDTGEYAYEKNCYRNLDTNTYTCVTNEKDYVPVTITASSVPKYKIDYYFTTTVPDQITPPNSSNIVIAVLVLAIIYQSMTKGK